MRIRNSVDGFFFGLQCASVLGLLSTVKLMNG